MLGAPRVRALVAQGSAVLRRPLPASSPSYQIRSVRHGISRGIAVDSKPSVRLRLRAAPPSLTKPIATVKSGPFLRSALPRNGLSRHVLEQRRFNNYYPGRGPEKPRMGEPQQRSDDWLNPKPLIEWRGIRTFHNKTFYLFVAVTLGSGAIYYFAHLETVPVSGRTRFNAYGPERLREAGEMEFKRVMWELEKKGVQILPDWDLRTVRVRRVMARLIPFSGMQDEDWEVFVVNDPRMANAFVIPGGKVFVFSGILNLARNDSGLATVLSHEIAHNLAGHHGERLSQDFGTNIVTYALIVLGGAFGLSPLLIQLFGSKVLDLSFGLPMSRLQESEADYIGLMMMAEACYDPHEAAGFWQMMERAERAKGGGEVPEWMSTHPANANRIQKMQEWLPQALEKRSQSDCSSTTAFADLFRHALRTGQILVF
ncbi:mitochondrial metalloendopeptidase OMA1 [Dichotomopilus funicola]|uniref:Mitochondrial metalloendopeptidase OMA1 n=1 Tax=Dichotomopilus funicola TaxID=1934379 RepID=A0AAN6V3R2_9PEZI|nr:mitochondrial metalloendopeptidase OMA1 [Dichotomopilus funicola]